MIASVSYPRSARRYSAWNPSISCAATVQSAVVPEVIKNRTGIPFASTAKCILVLSPLLCGPSPDSHHVRQRRRDALSHGWRRSSATQNLCHLPGVSRIFSHIPLSRHRQNRRCTFFQFPYVSGKSRQGAPVRRIQNTPLINCRVSRAFPPRVPFSPMVYGLSFSHALSLISCRCCSPAIFLPSSAFEDYYITLLLATRSKSIHTFPICPDLAAPGFYIFPAALQILPPSQVKYRDQEVKQI